MTSWNLTEPPRDGRTIILMGSICYQDSEGGYNTPILMEARFDAQWGWVDSAGMTVVSYHRESLHCHAWSEIPSVGDSRGWVLRKAEDES